MKLELVLSSLVYHNREWFVFQDVLPHLPKEVADLATKRAKELPNFTYRFAIHKDWVVGERKKTLIARHFIDNADAECSLIFSGILVGAERLEEIIREGFSEKITLKVEQLTLTEDSLYSNLFQWDFDPAHKGGCITKTKVEKTVKRENGDQASPMADDRPLKITKIHTNGSKGSPARKSLSSSKASLKRRHSPPPPRANKSQRLKDSPILRPRTKAKEETEQLSVDIVEDTSDGETSPKRAKSQKTDSKTASIENCVDSPLLYDEASACDNQDGDDDVVKDDEEWEPENVDDVSSYNGDGVSQNSDSIGEPEADDDLLGKPDGVVQNEGALQNGIDHTSPDACQNAKNSVDDSSVLCGNNGEGMEVQSASEYFSQDCNGDDKNCDSETGQTNGNADIDISGEVIGNDGSISQNDDNPHDGDTPQGHEGSPFEALPLKSSSSLESPSTLIEDIELLYPKIDDTDSATKLSADLSGSQHGTGEAGQEDNGSFNVEKTDCPETDPSLPLANSSEAPEKPVETSHGESSTSTHCLCPDQEQNNINSSGATELLEGLIAAGFVPHVRQLLENINSDKKTKLSQMEQELNGLRAQIRQKKKTNQQLQLSIKRKAKELEKLFENLRKGKAQCETLEEKYKALEHEKSTVDSKLKKCLAVLNSVD